MTIDSNDIEQLNKLQDAVNSDEGQLIINYIKQELAELDYTSINDDAPNEQVGQEFKVIKKIKEFFDELLIFKKPQT
jgi:hypothetical protein